MQSAIMQGQSIARDSATSHYVNAARFASEGRYSMAIGEMRRAMEFLPSEPQLRVDLADLLTASGDTGGATRELQQLADRTPPYGPAVVRLGDLRLAAGDTSGAVAHYQRLVARDTPFPPALMRLGDIAQQSGRRVQAIDHYREAVRADSAYVEAWLSLGSLLVIMDRYDEALEAFTRARRAAPDDESVSSLESLAGQRKQDYDEGTAAGKMRARIIVTATRQDAERVRQQVVGGADFISLCMKTSIDATAQVGGDLGFFGPGELLPQFEEAVKQLRVGQVSPIVQIPSGYAIVLRAN